MDNSKLIDRMKKLLAMSQDKGSENEAMLAAKRLHIMLAKHNISMTELDNNEETVDSDSIELNSRPWVRTVSHYVAKLYFCKVYYQTHSNTKASYFFIGTEANRTFALHIFKLIVSTIIREANAESRAVYGKNNCSFVNSFWKGAKYRIGCRCEELIQMAKEGSLQDEDGTNLPALLSTYEMMDIGNEEFLNSQDDLDLKKDTRKQKGANNHEGFQRGKAAGDRVQLSRTLQASNSPKLLS